MQLHHQRWSTIFDYMLLTSYTADIPESKDRLSVKLESSTFGSCHTCFVAGNQMKESAMERYRTLKHTLNFIKRLNYSNGKVAENFKALSMLFLSSVLSKFAVVGITPCGDFYALFRYGPVYASSFGTMRTPWECTINMLGDLEKNVLCIFDGKRGASFFLCHEKAVLAMPS